MISSHQPQAACAAFQCAEDTRQELVMGGLDALNNNNEIASSNEKPVFISRLAVYQYRLTWVSHIRESTTHITSHVSPMVPSHFHLPSYVSDTRPPCHRQQHLSQQATTLGVPLCCDGWPSATRLQYLTSLISQPSRRDDLNMHTKPADLFCMSVY